MATTLKTLPKFFGLSAAQYAALASKDANTLYFVYDAGVNGLIYRGSNVYGETIRYVSAIPEAADALKGVVYFNTTSGTAYVKSGDEIKPIGVITVDTISDADTTQNKSVPNVGAVKGYVNAKISTVFVYKGVKDTVADLPAVTATSDTTAQVGKTYYSRSGSGTTEDPYKYTCLTLAVGDTVPAGSYEGPKVGDLWCVKVGEDGQSAEYAWTRLESADPSEYKWEKLGSTIDYTIFMQKKTGATVGDIGTFDSNGDIIDSGKSISAAEVVPASTSTSAAVVANELEVAASLEAEAQARTTADATKLNKGSVKGVEDADEIIIAGGTDDAPAAVASGKKLGGSAFAATPDENTMATELAVQTKLDLKQDRDTDAVENNAAKFDANGHTVDAGKAFGSDDDTISSSSTANTLATEKAVAAAIASTGDTKQDKDTDAVVGNVGIFDANGQTVDGGKAQGAATLDVTASHITIGQITYGKASGTITYESEEYYPWSKMGETVVYTKSENPAVGDVTYTNTGTAETPVMTAGDTITLVEGTASANKLATEAAVKAAVDAESSRAKGVEALKLDEITGTNDNILLVAGNGTQVADSGKSISANTTVPASTATSVDKVANELEVAALKETVAADYQAKDKDAVSGNIAQMNSSGDSEDSGKQFGTGTLTTTDASANVLATEEAVVAILNTMAWQTVE